MGGARHFFTGPVRPEDVEIDENGEFKEQKFLKIKQGTQVKSTDKPISEVMSGPALEALKDAD
jgi:hypothetical protein